MNLEEQIVEDLKKITFNNYKIELGVISGVSKKREKTKIEKETGITNADLLFIHENGTLNDRIPRRPVLEMAIKYARENLLDDVLDECYDGVINKGWTEKEVERELNILCIKIQDYARDIIYLNDGRLVPNAPSTAKAKWKKEPGHKKSEKWQWPDGNHPLFDTGQLARSIVCKLTKTDE